MGNEYVTHMIKNCTSFLSLAPRVKPFVAAGMAGEGECAFENRPRRRLPPGHRFQRRRRRGRIALWVEGEGEEREGGGRGWRGERRPRIRPAHSSHFHICQMRIGFKITNSDAASRLPATEASVKVDWRLLLPLLLLLLPPTEAGGAG